MKKSVLFPILLHLLFLAGCQRHATEDSIPVLSLDDNDQPVMHHIRSDADFETYGKMVHEFQDQLIDKLENRPPAQNAPWKVRQMRIGFGIVGHAGIGLAAVDLRSFFDIWIQKKQPPTTPPKPDIRDFQHAFP